MDEKTAALSVDLSHPLVQLSELHIDRAYLSSSRVKNRDPELTIYLLLGGYPMAINLPNPPWF